MKKLLLLVISIIGITASQAQDCGCCKVHIAPMTFNIYKGVNMDLSTGMWFKLFDFPVGSFVGVKFHTTTFFVPDKTDAMKISKKEESHVTAIGTLTTKIKLLSIRDDADAGDQVLLLPYVSFGKNYYEAGTRLYYLISHQLALGATLNTNSDAKVAFGFGAMLVLPSNIKIYNRR